MPQITPIEDSKRTSDSMISANDIYRKLEQGERSIEAGDTMDAFESLQEIRKKHGLFWFLGLYPQETSRVLLGLPESHPSVNSVS